VLAQPAVDQRQLKLGADLGSVVLDEVLVEQHERDDLGHAAGDDSKHHPDDGLTEVSSHLPQHGQLTGGPWAGPRGAC